MASQEIFQATPKLKKASSLINRLESGRFSKLLSRVLQKVHLKEQRTFTPEEETKLQGALRLEPKDLELVLDTTTFIFQQAAYHLAKPALLKTHLQSIELDEEKVQVFVQAWTSQGKAIVEKLRTGTFYPKQLEDVKWRLNLQMAQSTRSKMKQPNALFEFSVREGEEVDKLKVEFSHDELFDFYQKLEAIQQQLDGL
ncbi:COMM domain-containing protein 10-like [Halichondria panicea]|uniref:COMM domain-containing protein 10-like n=1 Tax=Halichondria panicea TaxID=6063 RepID=UPI00312BAC38